MLEVLIKMALDEKNILPSESPRPTRFSTAPCGGPSSCARGRWRHRRRLGSDPRRRRTYDRKLNEVFAAEAAVDGHLLAFVGKLDRRSVGSAARDEAQ
jgi:hypothetical protein